MMKQEYFEDITDVVVASGTGGTCLDIALANLWSGTGKKIHGVHLYGGADYFFRHADKTLAAAGIINVNPRDIVDIIESGGPGYGIPWPELTDFCLATSVKTGIFLDRIYTGKAVFAVQRELRENAQRFAGSKLLFIHTGGIYGFIDGGFERELKLTNPMMNFEYEIEKSN